MHYGDKNHIKNNVLKLVVYTHGGDPSGTMFDVTSIQECKCFAIRLLNKIIECDDNMSSWFRTQPKFKDLKQERYYLAEFKQTNFETFDVINITDVTDDSNDLLHLH